MFRFIKNINAHVLICPMQHRKDIVTVKIYREYDLKKKHIAVLLGLIVTSIGILDLLSSITGHESYAQQAPTPTDFFLLGCDEIKDKVNDLLNSKGPVQKNLLAIKEMIFLMDLYDIKCSPAT